MSKRGGRFDVRPPRFILKDGDYCLLVVGRCAVNEAFLLFAFQSFVVGYVEGDTIFDIGSSFFII